jgi:hypothetical protein
MILSIGGCFVVRDADDHHRDRDKDRGHERHEGHRDGDRH